MRVDDNVGLRGYFSYLLFGLFGDKLFQISNFIKVFVNSRDVGGALFLDYGFGSVVGVDDDLDALFLVTDGQTLKVVTSHFAGFLFVEVRPLFYGIGGWGRGSLTRQDIDDILIVVGGIDIGGHAVDLEPLVGQLVEQVARPREDAACDFGIVVFRLHGRWNIPAEDGIGR